MTIFNIQHDYEKGMLERVTSLFTVLEDDTPIKRAFEKFSFLSAFVGSGLYQSQDDEVTISENSAVARPALFEAKRVVPRQMVMFNREALKTELVQNFAEGLEYQRFVGGIGDDPTNIPLISPFYDGVINGNTEDNVVIEENSFLNAYSKLNKVGIPYIVFNPNEEGASEEVKKFLEIFPNTIVSAPSWLTGTQHMTGIKGFITTTGAMTLGKFTDPVYKESNPDVNNNVTVRYTNEMFGLETFRKATAIIGTPQKPTVPVESVTMSQKTMRLQEGNSRPLTITITPEGAEGAAVTWESSDPAVATVDSSGNVTAIAVGTCTVTATAGGQSDTCAITVIAGGGTGV